MEQHWSKDYIEHLRATHFVLIVLCTAGLIIAFAPGNPEISPAHKQLDQIRTLIANWDPNFLQAPAKEATGPNLLPEGIGILTVASRDLVIQMNPRGPASFVTSNVRSELSSRTNVCETDPRPDAPFTANKVADVLAPPSNLQKFKDLWDLLSQGATLHQPSWIDVKVFIRKSSGIPAASFEETELDGYKGTSQGSVVNLQIRCLSPSEQNQIHLRDPQVSTPYYFHGSTRTDGSAYGLFFPVKMHDEAVEGQALLFRNKNETWHYGSFEESFRELSEALEGKDLAKLTWKAAVTELARQEERAPSTSFEAFGMKLPATASAYGALIMILGLQWYLWAQLYEFRRKLQVRDEVPDAAWINTYTSLPARSLAITSTFVLPVVAVAALGWRGANSHILELFSWPVSALGLGLSAALAFVTWQSTPTATPKEAAKATSTSA
jgi:hypothetical protein